MIPWAGPARGYLANRPACGRVCAARWLRRVAHQRRAHAPGATVALIQGAIDTTFDDEPRKDNRVMEHYASVTTQALEHHLRARQQDPSLPQTRSHRLAGKHVPLVAGELRVPTTKCRPKCGDLPMAAPRRKSRPIVASCPANTSRALGTPVLLGLGREHFTPKREQRFNSAAFISADGKLLGVLRQDAPRDVRRIHSAV